MTSLVGYIVRANIVNVDNRGIRIDEPHYGYGLVTRHCQQRVSLLWLYNARDIETAQLYQKPPVATRRANAQLIRGLEANEYVMSNDERADYPENTVERVAGVDLNSTLHFDYSECRVTKGCGYDLRHYQFTAETGSRGESRAPYTRKDVQDLVRLNKKSRVWREIIQPECEKNWTPKYYMNWMLHRVHEIDPKWSIARVIEYVRYMSKRCPIPVITSRKRKTCYSEYLP